METFADYILDQQDLAIKMDIMYYLSKKRKIFFNKSVVFKTEIARMFIDYMKMDINRNEVLTACLLCNCKKVDNAQEIKKIHEYAKEGANYLRSMGFSKKFSKMCEEINRYSGSNPREKESDILELVDQFGGMLLDRPERIGFKPDEAMILLEHRNLKDEYNRYLHTFGEFVHMLEEIQMNDRVNMPVLRKLTKIYNETEDLKLFIKKVCYEFNPKVDETVKKYNQKIKEEMLKKSSNRSLFSEETTRKILSHIAEENARIRKC